ncbi:hypothetical protein HMI54_014999 [Coelomomyces lativittatus]|nr:hypothetical protein HMI54_014999 [Coelomomyces lativittatus]
MKFGFQWTAPQSLPPPKTPCHPTPCPSTTLPPGPSRPQHLKHVHVILPHLHPPPPPPRLLRAV